MAWDAGAITGTLSLDTSPFVTSIGIAQQLGLRFAESAARYLSGGIELAAGYERAEMSMGVLLGSTEQAKEMMKDIQAFAAATPFKTMELIPAAKMLASTQAVEKIVPTLRMLGDVAAGTDGSLQGLALVYNQVATKGRISNEELMQFAERQVPIYQALADVMGVNVDQVDKIITKGQTGFPVLEAAFKSLTEEGGKFHGMTKTLSEGYSGLFSTITDNMSILQMGIGQGVLEGLDIKGLMGDTIKFQTEVVPGIVASVSQGVRTFKSEIEPLLAILKYMYDYWVELRDFTGDLGESAGNLWVGASNLINGDPMAKGETRTKEQLEAGGDQWGVPPINVNLEVKATTDEDQAGQIGTEVGKKIAAQLRATKAAKKLGGKAS